MKGLAPPDTLTGKIQRELNDEWSTQALISMWLEGRPNVATVRACLERLVREGRAESRFVHSSQYMSGGYTEFRRKQ